MDALFVNPALLGGTALVAVPVLIHLLQRQPPRRVRFPAIRFILVKEKDVTRRTRIKHWLVLLLRCLAVLLIALALARPVDRRGTLAAGADLPGAAVFVFDTSLSMDLLRRGQSRLDEAKDLALRLLASQARTTQWAVIDSAEGVASGGLSPDRALARHRIASLKTVADNRPLNESVAEAYRLCLESQLPRAEVYVFTDMAQGSWEPAVRRSLVQELGERVRQIPCYLVNLAVADPDNGRVASVEAARTVVPVGGVVDLTVTVDPGPGGAGRTLEIYLDGHKREEKRLAPQAGPSPVIDVSLSLDALGVHFGEVRLTGRDALAFDDRRYFVVEAAPPRRVLVTGSARADARPWMAALAPSQYVRQKRHTHSVEWRPPAELDTFDLTAYDVVSLIDLQEVRPGQWEKLANYVYAGGGLLIVCGPRQRPAAYNVPEAQALMPGTLGEPVQPPDPVYLALTSFTHPILRYFRGKEAGPGDQAVMAYRRLDPLKEDATRIVAYTDGRPALVERAYGQGRVVLLTTTTDTRWNDLPRAWPFLPLADGIVQYLSGGAAPALSFDVGQTIVIPLDRGQRAGRYTVRARTAPEAEASPSATTVSLAGTEDQLLIPRQTQMGHYDVRPSEGAGRPMGFCVNWPAEEADLTPLDPQRLEAFLGQPPGGVAHDQTSLIDAVGRTRVGRELFEFVILVLLIVLTVEALLANRFYRR